VNIFGCRFSRWDPVSGYKRTELERGTAVRVTRNTIAKLLVVAFTQSYDAARSLAFYNGDRVQLLFWARLPGDTLITVGTLLLGYDVVEKLFHQRATDDPDETDFSGVTRPLIGDD
jgi:hypothetical protein